MKYLNFYRKQEIDNNGVFHYFIANLKSSIKTWDYFVNWEKTSKNLDKFKIELNILNSLLGSKNLDEDFVSLINQYPNVIKVLPMLLAIRENKIEIIKSYELTDLSCVSFDFSNKHINEQLTQKYLEFIKNTGLIKIFKDEKIKNLVDYAFGVEVGLDSNSRKNRGGKLMEKIVEVFVKQCANNHPNIEYISQATAPKIKKKWNYVVKVDKSTKHYDFAVYNKSSNNLYIIETNFFNGGGSKLKSVCGEFKSLFNDLQKQNIKFIWITDGYGWNSTKRPLEETFNNTDYVFNLDMIQNNILEEVLN